MLKKLTRSIVALTLLTSVGACNSTPESTTDSSESSTETSAPGAGVVVRSSNSDWIEEQFLTEIVNIGLENLGYEVEEIQQAEYAAIQVSMANGDIDYTTGFYDPISNAFFENAGGDDKLEKIGQIILGGGVQAIFIDKKTADEYEITNLEQFQDPEIAQLFDIDGDGKANLAGCQAGWECGNVIDHQIEAFGLKDTVQQDQGGYAALIADVLTRQSQGEPVLYYAYSPHWLLSKLKPGEDAILLEVPFTAVPDSLADVTESDTTVDGKNLGFPILTQRIVASQTFVDENPIAKRLFEVIAIPVEDLNIESSVINDGEDSPEDIRRHAEEWVDNNSELFEGWLQEARQADG